MRYVLLLIYGVYNLFYQILLLYVLLFADTYLNVAVIPDKLIWQDGVKRMHPSFWSKFEGTMLLCVEGLLLLLLINIVNQRFLNKIVKTTKAHIISKCTLIVLLLITSTFILSILAGFYFPLP